MILRVIFRFSPIDPEAENVLLKRELLRRMRAPAGRSAGSVFRNPATTLPAGRILEKCGAKLLTEGRFQVSPDHANWIINRVDRTELASSEKAFVATTEAMAQKVYDSTGIILKPEVRFIDMETADNADINFIGVTWCVIKEEDFKSVGATYIANTPDDVIKIVEKLNKEGNL